MFCISFFMRSPKREVKIMRSTCQLPNSLIPFNYHWNWLPAKYYFDCNIYFMFSTNPICYWTKHLIQTMKIPVKPWYVLIIWIMRRAPLIFHHPHTVTLCICSSRCVNAFIVVRILCVGSDCIRLNSVFNIVINK